MATAKEKDQKGGEANTDLQAAATAPVNVTLKRKDGKGKDGGKVFVKSQAIALLTIKNSQWEIADEKFTWNGKDFEVKGDAAEAANAEPAK